MRVATPPPVRRQNVCFADNAGGGAIGVDLGGTHLRIGLVDETGNILQKIKREVRAKSSVESFFEQLALLIREAAGDRLPNLAGIGLGFPGICDPKKGIVYQLPHYPSWREVPAVQILKKHFSFPIILDNDANMSAIGEHWLGAARDWQSFIMLTLGTGIGGGIFLNGKIWRGDEGFAGEVGHMMIEREGRLCACGARGCWETYSASQAVPKGETAQSLAQAAEAGDPSAKKFWEGFGFYLGVGIGNLAKITGVHHYILNGGITNAAPHFLGSCRREIKGSKHERLAQSIRVIPSALKEEGNLLGCAYQIFKNVK